MPATRTTVRIRPLHDRVIVERLEEEKKTISVLEEWQRSGTKEAERATNPG